MEIPFFLIIRIPFKEVFILLFVQEVLALFVFLNDRTLNGFQAADNSTNHANPRIRRITVQTMVYGMESQNIHKVKDKPYAKIVRI
ncbi:MAG: hypothetical protein WBM07_01180 [Chitinivibrionales bacterium]